MKSVKNGNNPYSNEQSEKICKNLNVETTTSQKVYVSDDEIKDVTLKTIRDYL